MDVVEVSAVLLEYGPSPLGLCGIGCTRRARSFMYNAPGQSCSIFHLLQTINEHHSHSSRPFYSNA